MNLGKNIYGFRKERNITQEDLAAELGVTAAAVSKWENGYTLPDVMMLCALADFFDVTTDELLGRYPEQAPVIIAAETEALGRKIAELAKSYGYSTEEIHTDFQQAETAAVGKNIQTLIAGYYNGWYGSSAIKCTLVSVAPTEEAILDSCKYVFENHGAQKKYFK